MVMGSTQSIACLGQVRDGRGESDEDGRVAKRLPFMRLKHANPLMQWSDPHPEVEEQHEETSAWLWLTCGASEADGAIVAGRRVACGGNRGVCVQRAGSVGEAVEGSGGRRSNHGEGDGPRGRRVGTVRTSLITIPVACLAVSAAAVAALARGFARRTRRGDLGKGRIGIACGRAGRSTQPCRAGLPGAALDHSRDLHVLIAAEAAMTGSSPHATTPTAIPILAPQHGQVCHRPRRCLARLYSKLA